MFEKLSDADSCMTPVHCVTVLTYAHLSLGLRGEEHRVDLRSLTLCVCVKQTHAVGSWPPPSAQSNQDDGERLDPRLP